MRGNSSDGAHNHKRRSSVQHTLTRRSHTSHLLLVSCCVVFQYRVCQEGIDAIFPYMTRQVLRPSFADFMQLLLKGSLLTKHLTHRRDAFAVQLADDSVIQPGCCVLAVAGDRLQALTGQTLAMAAWKTQHSLALMIPEQERKSLTNLLTHRQPSSSSATSSHSSGANGSTEGKVSTSDVDDCASSAKQAAL